jgi:hypothetical protein
MVSSGADREFSLPQSERFILPRALYRPQTSQFGNDSHTISNATVAVKHRLCDMSLNSGPLGMILKI